MNTQPNSPSSDDALVRALIAHPDALDAAYHDTMVELMTDLAEGTLTGESLALACQLRDTDADARELYELMTTLPPLTTVSTAQPGDSIMSALSALVDELRSFYRALTPLPNSSLASGGKLRSEKKIIRIGNCTATLSINERPNGDFDADISISASSVTNPDSLEGLLLKVVDQPKFLKFRLTDGYWVASQPLPAKIAEPGKDLDIERIELE